LAALPDHHHALHRLAAGEELGLGQDRRPAAAGLAALPAALALGLQPGGALHGLDLVLDVPLAGLARLAGLADLDHRVRRVVGTQVLAVPATGGPAATAATAAGAGGTGVVVLVLRAGVVAGGVVVAVVALVGAVG